MLTSSSDFFSARRVSNSNGDSYDDLTDFNASFPSVDTLQAMMDDEEAEEFRSRLAFYRSAAECPRCLVLLDT